MSITSWLKKGQSLKRPRTDGLPDPTNCHDELDAKICASANERIDQLLTEPLNVGKEGNMDSTMTKPDLL